MSANEIGQVIAAVAAIGLAVLLVQPVASRLRVPDPLVFLGLGVVIAQWSRCAGRGRPPTSSRWSAPSR